MQCKNQQNDPDSLLSFYKELIALRKNPLYRETIVYGDLIPYLEDRHNLMAYLRKGEKTLLIAGNFQKKSQDIQLPKKRKKVLLNNYPKADITDCILHLKDYQAVILEL